MSDFITVMRETCPTPVVNATKWTRIGGNPHTVNLNAYLSKDGSKIMGTWICTMFGSQGFYSLLANIKQAEGRPIPPPHQQRLTKPV